MAVARRSGEARLVANTLADVGNALYLKGETRPRRYISGMPCRWPTGSRPGIRRRGRRSH